jgi:DNA-binding CsgD family transcriptional regulator/PAS domain-containing protein
MVVSEADYLDVLDLIQEAALEPAAWEKVLRRLARLTNCIAGGLTVEDCRTREGRPLVYFGFDDNHVEKTFAHYLPMNPLFEIAPRMKPGFVVTNGDVVPVKEFRRTEFYDGWARPQGLCCPVTVVLHRQDDVYCPLTLVRADGAGDATDYERALLDRLAPHLVRAMRVGMQIDSLRHQRSAMEAILTHTAIAVLLLDRNQRVVFANAAAEKLLASGTSLTTIKGTVVSRESRSNRELKKAILEVVARKPDSGAEIKIDRKQGRPLLATVLPLPAGNQFVPGLESGACCAVLVCDPESVQESRSNVIARIYGLTPAETRVLDSILSGTGLTHAARQIGVSLTTARTHLQRIFDKTGTGRQAELVNLVMTSTPPLNLHDQPLL